MRVDSPFSWLGPGLLILLGLVLFLPGLGQRDLWNPDEARYAEVAREMSVTGQYLVPHLNGELYTQKPPLLFWSANLSALLIGEVNETAARLPSALAAVATILLTYLLGCRLFDRRAAWLAAAVFATCARILWQGRFGQIDMLLTAWVTLALYFWLRGYQGGGVLFYRLFFVATGFATLAKGPVGLLPPLLAILAFLAIKRDRQSAREMRIGSGLLIWGAVVTAWLLPAGITAGGEYFREMLLTQNFTRFFRPGTTRVMSGHLQPWYHFLVVTPFNFLPWAALLPSATVIGWRSSAGRQRDGFWFTLSWALVTILFFSLSPGKRGVYVLTMFPALALLTGYGLSCAGAAWRRWRGWIAAPTVALALVFAALAAWIPGAIRDQAELQTLGAQLGGPLVVAMVGLAVLLTLAAVIGWRFGPPAVVAITGTGVVLFSAWMFAAVLPQLEPIKSARPAAEVLTLQLSPNEAYAIYPKADPRILFYSQRLAKTFEDDHELTVFMAQKSDVNWLLVRKEHLTEVGVFDSLEEVFSDQDDTDGYVLFRRR